MLKTSMFYPIVPRVSVMQLTSRLSQCVLRSSRIFSKHSAEFRHIQVKRAVDGQAWRRVVVALSIELVDMNDCEPTYAHND